MQTYNNDFYGLSAAMNAGQKINAIKILRTITNCGLKEAKDAVDNWDFDPDEASGDSATKLLRSLYQSAVNPPNRVVLVQDDYNDLKQKADNYDLVVYYNSNKDRKIRNLEVQIEILRSNLNTETKEMLGAIVDTL